MNIYREERPWGKFEEFTKNEQTTVKIITVNPLQKLSLQKHAKRKEFWRIIKGNGTVQIGGAINEAKVGDEFEIPLGELHRVSGGDTGMQFLEIAHGDFDENDIERFEDQYGRV
jgi:mannose-6-phosphate isomerase